jgi:outer membrane protein TolC
MLFFGAMAAPDAAAVTRKAAVAYALENAEAVQIAAAAAEGLRGEGRGAVAFTLPQATVEGRYLEMENNAPESPYPFLDPPGREVAAEFQASQLLFAGGRIPNSWALKKTLFRQADLTETLGRRDIRRAVRTAFDRALFQKASVAILADRVAQRQNELADARDLREVGMVTSLDVRQARLTLNLAVEELKAAQSTLTESVIDFNLTIGRSGADDPWFPEGDLSDAPEIGAVIGRLTAALDDPDLLDIRSRQVQAESARLTHRIAAGNRLPELRLVSSGESSGEEADDMTEAWAVGLQLRWDAFDGGAAKARQLSARADLRQARQRLQQTQKSVAGEIRKIIANIRSLTERIRLQKEATTLSKANYDDARGHYRAGTITLTRLGEFNLAYAESRFNLLRLYFLQREQIIRAEAVLERGS